MDELPGIKEEMEQLRDKMYISAVKNRLRAIGTPRLTEKRRWLYELMQNAKDSIANGPRSRRVDIIVTVTDQGLEFKHNGSPFVPKALLGLLYKYSEGKENPESTGRFGTGFLTTHCLSKEVTVRGDTYADARGDTEIGFEVTMCRSGDTDEELLAGLKRMRASWKSLDQLQQWTTFTYRVLNAVNRESLTEGLKNFRANGPVTLLFCNEIRSIQLVEGLKHVTFTRQGSTRSLGDGLEITDIVVVDTDAGKTVHRFVHAEIDEPNAELTRRFKQDRNLRLTIAVEVDTNNANIVDQNKDVPSHFCVFPLIGSEKHLMPVVINSPDFEPDSEREYLILDGPNEDPNTGVITEAGINRMILRSTVPKFNSLVRYFSAKHGNLHLLLKGLKFAPTGLRLFDAKWFKDTVISDYRKVVSSYPIVDTPSGRRKLIGTRVKENLCFVEELKLDNGDREREADDQSEGVFYGLVRDYVGDDRIPIWELNSKWSAVIWNEPENVKIKCELISVQSLCKTIAEHEWLDNLTRSAIAGFNSIAWLNRLFHYIQTSEHFVDVFSRYPMIPNAKGRFLLRESPGIATSVDLTQDHLDCVAGLGQDLSETLVHPEIDTIGKIVPNVISPSSLSSVIAERVGAVLKSMSRVLAVRTARSDSDLLVRGVSKMWSILRLIPRGSDRFAQNQRLLVRCIAPFAPTNPRSIEIDGLTSTAWTAATTWCIPQLTRYVTECKTVSALKLDNRSNKISWLNEFCALLRATCPETEFAKSAVIPNQKGVFCCVSALKKDKLPPIFKTDAFEQFGKDFRSKLVDPGITSVEISGTRTMWDVGTWVTRVFSRKPSLSDDTLQRLAFFLAHIVPPEPDDANRDSDETSVQRKILRLIRIMVPHRVIGLKEEPIDEPLPASWTYPLRICARSILTRVKEFQSLDKLGYAMKLVDPISCLSDVFDVLNKFHFDIPNICPNELGRFCSASELSIGHELPEELKEIQRQLIGDTAIDIRSRLIHPKFMSKIRDLHEIDLKTLCREIDGLVREVFDSPRKKDPKLRKPMALLCNKWADRSDAHQLFPYLLEQRSSIIYVMVLGEDKRELLLNLVDQPDLNLQWIANNMDRIGQLATEPIPSPSRSITFDTDLREDKREFLRNLANHSVDHLQEMACGMDKIATWDTERISSLSPELKVQVRSCIEHRYGVSLPPIWDDSPELHDTLMKIGMLGEIAVYKDLRRSGQYRDIKWFSQSEPSTGFKITDADGDEFWVQPSRTAMDIEAVTLDGRRIAIEVKATCHGRHEERMNLYISGSQLDMFAQAGPHHPVVLAVVHRALARPEITYFSIGAFPDASMQ
jgi:hypothetical protein